MKFRAGIVLLTLMAMMTACAPQVQKPDTSEKPVATKTAISVDTAAIRSIEQARLDALSKKDIDGYLSAYSDQAIWMPPGAAEIVGKAAARQRIGNALAETSIEIQLKSEEQEVMSSDWVLDRGAYVLSRTAKAGGKPAVEGGSYLTVWHKEAAGWKIAYDVWSSERPASGK